MTHVHPITHPRAIAQASVAPGAKALSAIKGIDFDDKGESLTTHCPRPRPLPPPPPLPRGPTCVAGIVLISDIIRQELSADCSVLMGANVRPRPRTHTPHSTRSAIWPRPSPLAPRPSPLASEAEGARRAGRASRRLTSLAVVT